MPAIGAAALLLLVAPGPQIVTDEVFEVPTKEWRYVVAPVKEVPVTVRWDYAVISGTGTVRATLVNADGLDDLKQGNREAMTGPFTREGMFSRVVGVRDDYAVVLENSATGTARVRLRVALDYSARGRPHARTLSLERRLAVIAISATVFLAIVSYSARKLLGAMRR